MLDGVKLIQESNPGISTHGSKILSSEDLKEIYRLCITPPYQLNVNSSHLMTNFLVVILSGSVSSHTGVLEAALPLPTSIRCS